MLTTLLLGLAVVGVSAVAAARLLFGPRSAVTVVEMAELSSAQGTPSPMPGAHHPGPRRARRLQRVRISRWERARAALGLGLLTAAIGAGLSVLLGAAVFAIGLVLQHAL